MPKYSRGEHGLAGRWAHPLLTQEKFQGMLYGMYFLDNVKGKKLKDDLKKCRQGDSVQEYLREFS